MGLFGAALLYGDGMITPAISVLSAVEGLNLNYENPNPYRTLEEFWGASAINPFSCSNKFLVDNPQYPNLHPFPLH